MTVIYVVFGLAGLLVLISAAKTGRFFTALFLTAFQGVAALFAADFVGSFIGVNLSINGFTAALSALGGIPAVVFLLLSGVLFR